MPARELGVPVAADYRELLTRSTADAMVHVDEAVEPDPRLGRCYGDKYAIFLAEIRRRGYLSDARTGG